MAEQWIPCPLAATSFFVGVHIALLSNHLDPPRPPTSVQGLLWFFNDLSWCRNVESLWCFHFTSESLCVLVWEVCKHVHAGVCPWEHAQARGGCQVPSSVAFYLILLGYDLSLNMGLVTLGLGMWPPSPRHPLDIFAPVHPPPPTSGLFI